MARIMAIACVACSSLTRGLGLRLGLGLWLGMPLTLNESSPMSHPTHVTMHVAQEVESDPNRDGSTREKAMKTRRNQESRVTLNKWKCHNDALAYNIRVKIRIKMGQE